MIGARTAPFDFCPVTDRDGLLHGCPLSRLGLPRHFSSANAKWNIALQWLFVGNPGVVAKLCTTTGGTDIAGFNLSTSRPKRDCQGKTFRDVCGFPTWSAFTRPPRFVFLRATARRRLDSCCNCRFPRCMRARVMLGSNYKFTDLMRVQRFLDAQRGGWRQPAGQFGSRGPSAGSRCGSSAQCLSPERPVRGHRRPRAT